ncbi:hypothetical protein BU24DRAFT_280807 [Aaosphaeria arxii CBS 175.79]|uniref:Uncharacterized protein n=1 Tax=Aaosphaeria arxii CBS 175.79 TaxID=1450172 RepID=A0A6A5XE35_9PLEO|nr:uncharacterized protein BU24DRAFT_280807 [Aaosphaeria arxii CBS 175.79]KAF2011425.1 hypothetical protein BU24DRAFT_280807 [Aaosphaeria arxii CBS 175.79]
MRSFFRGLILALPLAATVVCDEPNSPTKEINSIYHNAHEAFQDLLNALPEESLHAALNSLGKFKDGVFQSDRHGVERVHIDNPPLATKLIVDAIQDLRKRQNPPPAPSNGTEPSTPPPSSPTAPDEPNQTPSQTPTQTPDETPVQTPSTPPPSSNPPPPTQDSTPPPSQPPTTNSPPPPPSSSQESAVIVPVPITQTDSAGQPTVISSAILSQPTASVVVPVTRTNEQGQTQVVSESRPAVIFTATDTAGQPFVTTSAVDFAPTKGQVLTRTNSRGSTFLTTYTPDGGKVSSIVLITTTGDNGQPSVVTSYTFVDPAASQTNGEQPTGTQSGNPRLQSKGAAGQNKAMGAAFVGLLAFLA